MRYLLLLLSVGFAYTSFAQSPGFSYESMSYQGIARDATGNPVPNQSIGVRFTIFQGLGTAYEETQNVSTNDFGLFTTRVGIGTSTGLGAFNNFWEINWNGVGYSMNVAVDLTGGTNYLTVGGNGIHAVPFAHVSREAGMLRDSAWVTQPFSNTVYNTGYDVGIGTDAPASKLEVVTSTSKFQVVENPTAGFTTTAARLIGTGPREPLMVFSRETSPFPGPDASWAIGGDGLNNFGISTGGVDKAIVATPDHRVGINTNTPNPGAALEVESTTGGVLLPRVTTAQRDAMTVEPGTMIYNTDARKFQGYYSEDVFTLEEATSNSGSIQVGSYTEPNPPFNQLYFEPTMDLYLPTGGTLDTLSFWVDGLVNGTSFDVELRILDMNFSSCGSGTVLASQMLTITQTGKHTVGFPSPPMLTAGTLLGAGDHYGIQFIPQGPAAPTASYFTLGTANQSDVEQGSLIWSVVPFSGCIPLSASLRFEIISVRDGSGWVDLH
jgi:hypothetical protein